MSVSQIRELCARIDYLEQKLDVPKFVTARQVADLIGVSLRAFCEMKREGNAPRAIYWSQRTVHYDRDDVMAWADTLKEDV